MHYELRKSAEFFASAEAQYAVRNGRIKEGLRQLQIAMQCHASTQLLVLPLSTRSAASLAAVPRSHAHACSASRDEEDEVAAMALLGACLSLYKDEIVLENFAVMAHLVGGMVCVLGVVFLQSTPHCSQQSEVTGLASKPDASA